ncbi:hypothetical protein N8522_01705 [Akkermansiaceae bacterium]|nr:hypothetical protein [Akkermansiaceae bacterium]
MVLKLLRTIGGANLELLVTFFDFAEKEIREAIRPLRESGFVIIEHEEYRLSDVGEKLFSLTPDDGPSVSESESLERNFRVDDHCGLPIPHCDLRPYFKKGLKWLIDELPVDASDIESPNDRVLRSFNVSFESFIQNEQDQEKIRSEKMTLHKTEYCRTKDSLLVRADVCGALSKIGSVTNRVTPFDDLMPRSESRRVLRDALVRKLQSDYEAGSEEELEFLRKLFGQDFLTGCVTGNVLAWFKIIPRFFKERWPRLESGVHLAVGEAAVLRNLTLVLDLLEKVLSEREVSAEFPLKIVWIRPSVGSWGRSFGFLDAVEALRVKSKGVPKGAVQIELWESSGGIDAKTGPQQRSYEAWFDGLKRFSSRKIPAKMEMLLIGDAGGVALSHAFTPPQSYCPCPIGVYFEEHAGIQELMSSEVHGGLRALPRLAKKKKKTAK